MYFDVVLRYALAVSVHHAKQSLRDRISLLRRSASIFGCLGERSAEVAAAITVRRPW
jgi:hypothetical protein